MEKTGDLRGLLLNQNATAVGASRFANIFPGRFGLKRQIQQASRAGNSVQLGDPCRFKSVEMSKH
jgi:hypothetical protein